MKKFLSVLIAGIIVLSVTACGNNSGENKGIKYTLYEDTWEGDGVKIAVDFYYPEDADIEIDADEDYLNNVSMHYKSKNITIGPSLFEDTTFDANKEYAKENKEDYKEFKINGYDCYGYEAFGGYWIYVLLEEVSETTDRYLVIDTEVIDYSIDGTPKGIGHYEDEDIKKIIESFEYRGVVSYQQEETEE